MALSRLSSAPENASGYALPITQLTKSPPGPEAKVDSVLLISLSSLAANFVQASVLPPPGTRNSHRIAGSQFSLAQRRPRHHHTTQWQWHLRSNGRRTADRSSRPRPGPLSRRGALLTRTFAVDETGKLLPSVTFNTPMRKPCLLICGRPSCIRKACDRRLPSSKRAVSI